MLAGRWYRKREKGFIIGLRGFSQSSNTLEYTYIHKTVEAQNAMQSKNMFKNIPQAKCPVLPAKKNWFSPVFEVIPLFCSAQLFCE